MDNQLALFKDDGKNNSISLGNRMKSYEDTRRVPETQCFLIRADGNCFSKYTKGLRAPFDDVFSRAMIKTANGVLKHFTASTVFVCSDEITLVFKKCYEKDYPDDKKKSTHIYSGRYEKLITLVAGKCSVLFNKFMLEEVMLVQNSNSVVKYLDNFILKIQSANAIFDARMIPIEDGKEVEIINNLIWRSCYDCYRNSVSTYSRHIIGKSNSLKKNSNQMILLMELEMNKNSNPGDMIKNKWSWNDEKNIPMYHKYGCFGKSILVEMTNDINATNLSLKRHKSGMLCVQVAYRKIF